MGGGGRTGEKTSEAYHHIERRKIKYVSKVHTKIYSDFSSPTWIKDLLFWIGKYCVQRNKGIQQIYKLCILLSTRNVKEKDMQTHLRLLLMGNSESYIFQTIVYARSFF